MAWFILLVAGLCECVWALALKRSDGFHRPVPSAIFLVMMTASMLLLARALRTLPVGTAYAVWTGIGAAGTAILGMVWLGEPRTALKVVSLVLLLAGIAGLRLAGE